MTPGFVYHNGGGVGQVQAAAVGLHGGDADPTGQNAYRVPVGVGESDLVHRGRRVPANGLLGKEFRERVEGFKQQLGIR